MPTTDLILLLKILYLYANKNSDIQRGSKFFITFDFKLIKGNEYTFLIRVKFKSDGESLKFYEREKAVSTNADLIAEVINPYAGAETEWSFVELNFVCGLDNIDTIYLDAEGIYGEGSFVAFEYIMLSPHKQDKIENFAHFAKYSSKSHALLAEYISLEGNIKWTAFWQKFNAGKYGTSQRSRSNTSKRWQDAPGWQTTTIRRCLR